MIENILYPIFTLILLLVSGFALYLPLLALLKDKRLALKFAIPISISVEMLVGYIFYNTNAVSYFPLIYLILVIVLNIVAILKLRPLNLKLARPNLGLTAAITLVLILALFYTRYIDSFLFVGPGSNDTYHHLTFIRNLLERGFLSNGYYAPGFHLFMMPIAKVIPLYILYRFAGPALGLLSVLSIILALKDRFKSKLPILALIGLMSFPILNQMILQTIGFFSSSLTFLVVSLFIAVADDKEKKKKVMLGLLLVVCLALAVNVPYFFITLLPAFLFALVVSLIFRRWFQKKFPKYLVAINLILLLGVLASLGHVYIQSNLLGRYYGFPNVRVAVEPAKTTPGETPPVDSGDLTAKLDLPTKIKNSPFLRPMIGAILDLAKVKNVRPATTILGFGGYVWLALSAILLVYSARKKNSLLFVISSLSLVLGVMTQTGIGEMSYYRGRSGWYLMLLCIMGIAAFIDEIGADKYKKAILISAVIMAILGFIIPPIYYRPYYEDQYREVKKIAAQYPGKTITLLAYKRNLSLVAPNLEARKHDDENLFVENSLVIIEKEVFKPNPVLGQMAVSSDKGFSSFNDYFSERKKEIEEENRQIKSTEGFSAYKKVFDNGKFEIYSNIN